MTAETVQTELDPTESNYVLIVGRKGSGKSIMAEHHFLTYPGDRVVLDPTGDVSARPKIADATKPLELPLPERFPDPSQDDAEADMRGAAGGAPAGGRRRRDRLSLRFVPTGPPDEMVAQMDAVVRLAYQRGRMLVHVDEMADLAKVHRTPRWTHQSLYQGRHRDLSMLFCGPRPASVDPLVVWQADIVIVFDLPNPDDRKKLAANAGIAPAVLDEAIDGLDPYEYVRIDIRAPKDDPNRVLVLPPLPKHLA